MRHPRILICRAIDDALFDFVLAVDPRGPFATVRIFCPLLRPSGHGLVVNVGSVAGAPAGAHVRRSQHRLCRRQGWDSRNDYFTGTTAGPGIRVVTVASSVMETSTSEMWTSEPGSRATRSKQIGREYATVVILGLATTVTSARSSPVDGGSQL